MALNNSGNPKFFEPVRCADCGCTSGDMVKHRYTDEVVCVDCLNIIANEFQKEQEKENENNDNENENSSIWEERGFNSSGDYANFITRGA